MSEPEPDRSALRAFVSDSGTVRILAAVLILAVALALALRLDRSTEEPLAPPDGRIVFVDVEGWYRRTPDEVAVRTPFDLTLDKLPAALPLAFGDWTGEDRPHDPEVDTWLRNPEVSIERTYVNGDGSIVWLSAFGSRGAKSFHLFEHAPETCYPLGGWKIDRFERLHLPRGPRPLPVNYGLAHNGGNRMVFAYLYLWDTAARDPEAGVLAFRLAAPVQSDPEATWSVVADDFLAQIFPATLDWCRF